MARDPSRPYDLVCIGSGPAGQRAAIQAAKLGKRVAVIERQRYMGGVCIQTGTIPSKTFREAVLRLTRRAPDCGDGIVETRLRLLDAEDPPDAGHA